MKHALAFGIGLALCLSAAGAEGETIDPAGTWVRTTGETEITISHCGEDLCAVNDWVRDPDSEEKAGDMLVMSLHEETTGKLEGEAYDKRRDCRYAMSLSMTPDGLHTEGCVLFGIVCKSAEWKRER
jgi:uncharacterized protein (DUF2147 family)